MKCGEQMCGECDPVCEGCGSHHIDTGHDLNDDRLCPECVEFDEQEKNRQPDRTEALP